MASPCVTGRRRYANAEQADNALANIWSRCKPGRRLETRAYHCRRCRGWHLTSQPYDPTRRPA